MTKAKPKADIQLAAIFTNLKDGNPKASSDFSYVDWKVSPYPIDIKAGDELVTWEGFLTAHELGHLSEVDIDRFKDVMEIFSSMKGRLTDPSNIMALDDIFARGYENADFEDFEDELSAFLDMLPPEAVEEQTNNAVNSAPKTAAHTKAPETK